MILPEGIVVPTHPRAVVGDVPVLVDVEATEPPPNIETRQQPRDSECAAQRSYKSSIFSSESQKDIFRYYLRGYPLCGILFQLKIAINLAKY